MSSVAEDVQTFIVALGAPWSSSNVFIGEMGDTPDTACCVYEYPGDLERFLGAGPAKLETARFQVVTRATGYSSARQYAETLLTALDSVAAVAWADRVMAQDTPHPLPKDEHERPRFAVNYAALKER
jgi:hypothetical protein